MGYKIAFAVCLSAVAALPLEDTAEVKAAKDAFATVYKTVEAGEHINLMPVNNDVQAPQIANAYLDDTMDVAEAKEAFMAAFRNVEAGGLEAMQAPAPRVAAPASYTVQVPKVTVPATYAVPHTYGYGYPTVYAHGFPYVMPAVQAAEKVEEDAVEMA